MSSATSRRRRRRLHRDRAGTVALEFGFIASGFLLMLLGTIEMARYLFTQQSLELLTGLVARAAVVGTVTPACPLTLPASIAVPPILSTANLSVCLTQPSQSGGKTEYQVTSSYTFTFLLPVFAKDSGMISTKTVPVF